MSVLLRRVITQAFGGSEALMNWINPANLNSNGISISSFTLPASGSIGYKIELDVKLNQSSHSRDSGLLTQGQSVNSNNALIISDTGTLTCVNMAFIFSGLDFYNGSFHSVVIEKTNTLELTITVDGQSVSNNITSDLVANIITGTTSANAVDSLDGTIKNLKVTNASSVVTHNMKINDGTGSSTIANTGTTADGTINGTENTDYQWE